MTPGELGLKELRDLLKKGELTCKEVIDDFKRRIDRFNKELVAFITIDWGRVYERAKKLDTSVKKEGAIFGCPIAIKDNILTKGLRTTAGSKILENYLPPYSATVVERLEREGAIIIGKTNLDEFAMGSSTENSAFFPTLNPWDKKRVPGGSSGGSAVAVASFMSPCSLGSDTGGSIRQPASFCGIYGLKPTYGRVSRYGLIAFASSLDQIGPMARSVEDIAIIMNVISGHDEKDSTSSKNPVPDYAREIENKVSPFRFGILDESEFEGIDEEIFKSYIDTVNLMEKTGGKKVKIDLPHLKYSIYVYYILATSEASSNLARYDGIRYGLRVDKETISALYMETRSKGFGMEVKRRILLGTFSLSAGYYREFYGKASAVRELIKRDFENAFREVDFIILPTTPELPFLLGEKIQDPVKMYLSDLFTITPNLAMLPAISIPVALSKNKLPIGIQIISNIFEESNLLNLSFLLEKNLNFSYNELKRRYL
ncbi:MAG: Asp-tRNA(Asn)/Glu-tRNA(Gln) amidotransferase subunit GatA [Candidatus Aminicenantia bacterium]